LVSEKIKENHQIEKWWNSSSSREIKKKETLVEKQVELRISQVQQVQLQQMKSLEEQPRVEIAQVQQLLSNSLNGKNAQITQLQSKIQSLESEMIDVGQFKQQELQVNDQLN